LDIICLFLVFAAVGKSAQIGLHTWLPDAMEGPTPVSALIHAATMVTAGIFLLMRCSDLFEQSETSLLVITLLGVVTILFSSGTAFDQFDLKKIIAFSTCSQLGYMFYACGIEQYQVAQFHLFNHAFFKALLFLGAGSIIHAVLGDQDIRRMGGLRILVPMTYTALVVGSISLMGAPFLTGFYSKDTVMESGIRCFLASIEMQLYFTYLGAITTACYSLRLL